MSLLKIQPSNLLSSLGAQLPEVTLTAGQTFMWSPAQKTVTYSSVALNEASGAWSLLHEAAHASLNHHNYSSDFELLMLEVAAWQEAKKLAESVGVPEIDEEHIQDCLDTYRDWLHKRSTCPTCGSVGLQHSSSEYRCHNCHSSWAVTPARFCRPYRRKQHNQIEKSPDSIKNQTTFQ